MRCKRKLASALADYPLNALRLTSSIFQLHRELHHHHRKLGRAKHLANKKQGKGEKQSLIGQTVLVKW
jgi:hypothetical protein